MGPFLKNNVISQERDCSKPNRLLCHLTRKGPLLKKQTVVSSHKRGTASQTDKDHNKIVATDHKMRVDLWNLVTTCGMALRLEILIAGGTVSPQAWSSSAKKENKHFSYCPGDSTHSVQWVIIQDKPGRVLRSFVLDHSWTRFNQRPSVSRNCCRTREEPLKPCQETFFCSTLFFLMETN